MLPKKLQELINKLAKQMTYMDSALGHIDCAITEDKNGITIQRPVSNPMGMSSDLTDGINLVKEICESYSTLYNEDLTEDINIGDTNDRQRNNRTHTTGSCESKQR